MINSYKSFMFKLYDNHKFRYCSYYLITVQTVLKPSERFKKLSGRLLNCPDGLKTVQTI